MSMAHDNPSPEFFGIGQRKCLTMTTPLRML